MSAPNGLTFETLVAPGTLKVSGTGAPVDIKPYEGEIVVNQSIALTQKPWIAHIEQSANGVTGWYSAGFAGTFTSVELKHSGTTQQVVLDADGLERHIRYSYHGGAGAGALVSVDMGGFKKYR